MKSLTQKFLAVALGAALAPLAAAGGGMQNALLDNFNSTSNVTAPSASVGPSGSYLGGGGVQIRGQVSNATLAGFNKGGITAGCGGISLTAPSMSFIGSEELVDTAKNIGANASYLLFQMAIDQVSANFGNAIKTGMEKLDKLNMGQLNSCQIAQSLVSREGSLMNNTAASSAQSSGAATDANQASNPNNGNSAASTYPTEKIRDNYIWSALKNQNVAGWLGSTNATTDETREQLMSLIGTVISCEDSSKPCGIESTANGDVAKDPELRFYGPTIHLADIISRKSSGLAEIEVYKCNDDKCMTMKKVKASNWLSIEDQINDVMFGKDGKVGFIEMQRLNNGNMPAPTAAQWKQYELMGDYLSMTRIITQSGRYEDAKDFAKRFAPQVAATFAYRNIRTALLNSREALQAKNNPLADKMVVNLNDRIREIDSEYASIIAQVGGPGYMKDMFETMATAGYNYGNSSGSYRMNTAQ